MTGAEAVAQVQQGLGWRTDRATEILAALNFAQDEREQAGKTLPWFLLQFDQVTTTTGVAVIFVSTNVIKLNEFMDQAVQIATSTSYPAVPLFPNRTKWARGELDFYGPQPSRDSELVSTTSFPTGAPRAYEFFHAAGQSASPSIWFWPIPDRDYVVTVGYYSKQADIVADSTTNLWLTYNPWVIVGAAGWKLAADIQNQAAMMTFGTILQRAEQTLMSGIVEQELAGRRLSMGGRL